MRVAILHPKVIQGGAEKIVIYLAKYLKLAGHEPEIITLYANNAELSGSAGTLKIITPLGITGRLCALPLFRKIFGFIIMFFMFFKNKNKYDAVHANNFPSHWIAALLAPDKTVWQCNEPPLKMPASHIKSVGLLEYVLSRFYTGFWDKALVSRIKAISVLDKMNYERVLDIYKRKAEIILIGIDEDYLIKVKKTRAQILKQQGLSKNKRYLIATGNLVAGKNQQCLIRAMKELEKTGVKNTALIIVGRGPEEKRLKELTAELNLKNIVFKGFLSNEELRELYYISELNLFAAVNQSWGLTPFEAAAQGTLSIVSSDCGAAWILKKHKIGFSAVPDPADFSREISRALSLMPGLAGVKKRAELFVRNKITWYNYALEMLKLFKKNSR